MAIPITMHDYLKSHHIDYDLIAHPKTSCSAQTADATHIPDKCLAKGVLVKRQKGYLLAIVPANRRLELSRLGDWLKQPVCLATEDEVSVVFGDCDQGAVPAVGAAYGVRTVLDERLLKRKDVYFEGGDHRTLVHVDHKAFEKLMQKVPINKISKEREVADHEPRSRFEEMYWGA